MSTLDDYEAARELLRDPARWCKGAGAILADGRPAPGDEDHEGNSLHPDAVAWCAVGALHRTAGRIYAYNAPAVAPLRAAIDGLIGPWNDAPERTHADVLAAYDRAIAALRERDVLAQARQVVDAVNLDEQVVA